jgi:hypothetical protein
VDADAVELNGMVQCREDTLRDEIDDVVATALVLNSGQVKEVYELRLPEVTLII